MALHALLQSVLLVNVMKANPRGAFVSRSFAICTETETKQHTWAALLKVITFIVIAKPNTVAYLISTANVHMTDISKLKLQNSVP